MHEHFLTSSRRLLFTVAALLGVWASLTAFSIFTEPKPGLDVNVLVLTDCCNGSKPKSLTLRYNGQGCGSSNTSQELGSKWECADFGGGPNGDPTVYIVASKESNGSGGTYFSGNVNLNVSFVVDAANAGESKFPSNTWFSIYASQGGTLLQRVRIHTSCSAPIVIGDQFGSLVLEGVTFENGTSCAAPPQSQVCPEPVINSPSGQICKGSAVQFSAPDLGYACLTYAWDFGSTASPQFATGKGPHNVTFSSAGAATVKLTIDNGCDNDLPAGGSSGSGSSGQAGSGSGSGSNGQSGGVICPSGGSGSGGSSGSSGSGGSGSGGSGGTGSGSNGTSGSNGGGDPCGGNAGSSGSGGSGSGGSGGSGGTGSGSGSGSGGSGDTGSDCPCIECRKTKTIMVQVENCTPGATGKIGDFVWRDNNQNGIQDAGEPGIANVYVILEKCNGAFVKFTTTDANGMYMFQGLQGGQYRVKFSNPGGLFATTKDAGSDDCKDSDADQFGYTACFTLGDGATNLCVDAGFKGSAPPPCSVNPVVTNILCDGKGTSATNDDTYTFVLNVTGSGGSSQWTGSFNHACLGVFAIGPTAYGTPVTLGPFPAGQYSCGNTSPPIVYQNGLDISVSVSDAQNANCSKNITVVSPGPCSPAGTASIGDFYWEDINKNGRQDPTEPGIFNRTVSLYKCDGTFVAQTTTNSSGFYSFTNLPSNQQYYVQFQSVPGLVFSPKDAFADNIDSDADGTGKTDCTFLSPGENENSIDAGAYNPNLQQQALVGNFVWNDLDKDGLQDPNEPGLQNVTVKLFRCDGTFVAQTTTSGNGAYQFSNVPPDLSYFLEFSGLPAGYQFTTKDVGGDDTVDSDADPANGRTACFSLAQGQSDVTRDAGAFQSTQGGPASVGDFVWFDTNANGVQDAGEPGVSGVFVILETCTGQFVNFATTNAQGAYLINNVQPGSYRIKFASPGSINGSPVNFTVKDAGGDDTKDSDANSLGFTDCFTLNAGQSNSTLDAGFTGQAPPPPLCSITATPSGISCVNGQTCFTLVVNGTNTGGAGYDIPSLNKVSLQYGQSYNLCMASSPSPMQVQVKDHNLSGCSTTFTIKSPPPCNTSGGGASGCDGITFTGGSKKITIANFSAPIVLIKVFNASWQTVFECNSSTNPNCVSPVVASNLPAGTYFVNTQLYTATWSLICKKEGYVTVTNFTGGGGGDVNEDDEKQTGQTSLGETGDGVDAIEIPAINEAENATGKSGDTSLEERTGEGETGTTAIEPADLNLLPNPAAGHVLVHWGKATSWQQAELVLLNQLGQVVRHVELADALEGSHRLDLSDLKGGQYMLRFRADGAAPIVKKLIISR